MTNLQHWEIPAGLPLLSQDHVHIWRVRLDLAESALDHFRGLLSEDERRRAGRFYFRYLRTRFTAARGALRTILGAYLDRAPGELTFAYTSHGKPYLPDSALCFNLSHSGPLGLIAVSLNRQLGVDIERISDFANGEAIARRFFAPSEVHDFLSVPPERRAEAFFNGWTRKEAFIKAIGEGLSYPLHSFSVSLRPGETPQLLSIDSDPQAVKAWKLAALDPGEGYAAALIAEGRDWQPYGWEFVHKQAPPGQENC